MLPTILNRPPPSGRLHFCPSLTLTTTPVQCARARFCIGVTHERTDLPPLLQPVRKTYKQLHVSPSTGERQIRRGDFPPVIRIGGQRFNRPADVVAWLEAKAKQGWQPVRGKHRPVPQSKDR